MKSIVQRYRRRFRIGKAYCMAKEIAPYLPEGGRVIDIGCGNGFIAHHLRGLRDGGVLGVDVARMVQAPIAWQQFDGRRLPFADHSFAAALLCYVLHHAPRPIDLLAEAARVVNPGGSIVIYEDVPESWWDHLFAWRHSLAWRSRTGPCRFFSFLRWQEVFASLKLPMTRCRLLSRCRDFTHPVLRAFFVLTVP